MGKFSDRLFWVYNIRGKKGKTDMIKNVVRILNELLTIDPKAINKFFKLGVSVNQNICDHPTVQILSTNTMRPLGLLNGLIQEDDQIIVMIMDMPSEKTIVKFTIGTLNKGKVSLHE